MEYNFYELRPFIFLAFGLLAIVYSMSALMTMGGWTIVTCAGVIIHTRLRHRGHL